MRNLVLGTPLILATLGMAGCQLAVPILSGASASPAAGPALTLAVDPLDGSLLKAEGGLFRSIDRGQNWETIPVAAAGQQKLSLLATSAAAPNALYAAGSGTGLLRSDDRGLTWRAIGTGLPRPAVAALAVHSLRPDTLFVSVEGQGVFRTEDGGSRWQRMDAGPPAAPLALAHSTLEGSMNTGWLYAATLGGSYFSMDCF